jgi:hypothetical protein
VNETRSTAVMSDTTAMFRRHHRHPGSASLARRARIGRSSRRHSRTASPNGRSTRTGRLYASNKVSVQLVEMVRATFPVTPCRPARHDFEYRRCGTANLFLASAPLQG